MTTITTIIKRKSDIEDLLNEMPEGSSITVPSVFSGYGEGVYRFEKIDNDTFSNYNSGQNWYDREASDTDRKSVIDIIWENRKTFNQHKREMISLGFPIIEYH